mgnify:CR=1 FL=1
MVGFYVCNVIAGAGLTLVIHNHVGLELWECVLVSFSITWFWGKS